MRRCAATALVRGAVSAALWIRQWTARDRLSPRSRGAQHLRDLRVPSPFRAPERGIPVHVLRIDVGASPDQEAHELHVAFLRAGRTVGTAMHAATRMRTVRRMWPPSGEGYASSVIGARGKARVCNADHCGERKTIVRRNPRTRLGVRSGLSRSYPDISPGTSFRT